MNTASLRRRGYKKKEDGIVLPAGYTLGTYARVRAGWHIYLSTLASPYSVECLIDPATNTNYSAIIFGNGTFDWGIAIKTVDDKNKPALPYSKEVSAVEETFLTPGTPRLVEASEGIYTVDGINTGLSPQLKSYPRAFAGTSNGNYAIDAKIYYLKIYKDGECIHHYVPVINPELKARMYDLIAEEEISCNVGYINVY